MEKIITIRLKEVSDVNCALDEKVSQRIILRYLHDRGIEGDLGCDEEGSFIKYYKPHKRFDDFSAEFYRFLTSYGK